jgi:hypothetical protein
MNAIANTFAANIRHAIANRQEVEIGGGTFTPEELRALLDFIEGKTKTRTHAEPLTIAYVAAGAFAEWEKMDEKTRDHITDLYEGQLHFIDAVIANALELDRYADEHPDDLLGVFAYEIAEPFGQKMAVSMIAQAPLNARALAFNLYATQD